MTKLPPTLDKNQKKIPLKFTTAYDKRKKMSKIGKSELHSLYGVYYCVQEVFFRYVIVRNQQLQLLLCLVLFLKNDEIFSKNIHVG